MKMHLLMQVEIQVNDMLYHHFSPFIHFKIDVNIGLQHIFNSSGMPGNHCVILYVIGRNGGTMVFRGSGH